ncbi:MAG: type II toxin-antitoxin system RelE/ParE family toxin [Candidatus Yonathbacteria bacterium]|nr:type II toxin-antitoxin system RelE/ParE family toxin [Candidatus Yonathbacteria bacterium]
MEIAYLPKAKGFIEKLDDILLERVLSSVDFLEKYGALLEMPLSKPLGKGLFELRIVGNIHIRIFYCFHKNTAYILHAIVKKQQVIPKKEIDFARKVMREVVII